MLPHNAEPNDASPPPFPRQWAPRTPHEANGRCKINCQPNRKKKRKRKKKKEREKEREREREREKAVREKYMKELEEMGRREKRRERRGSVTQKPFPSNQIPKLS